MTGTKNRYIEIWDNYTQRQEAKVGAGLIKKANRRNGWMKAADLLLHDLYTVWRALEGLPVWPSYVEGQRGWWHGGDRPCLNGPELIGVDEALRRVGLESELEVVTAAE